MIELQEERQERDEQDGNQNRRRVGGTGGGAEIAQSCTFSRLCTFAITIAFL